MTVHRRDLLRRPLARAADVLAERTAPLARLPGAAPELPADAPGAVAPRIHVLAYGPFELHEHVAESGATPAAMRGRFPVLWVHVDGIGHAETVRALGEGFGVHRLALEDVMDPSQRAKVEDHGGLLFLVARTARRAPALEIEQIAIVLGPDFVVSFQERPGDVLDPVRARIRAATGRIRHLGPDHLAYALLDAVVDPCVPVVQAYADELDALEDAIAAGAGRAAMIRLHAIRRDLMSLRRAIGPLGDALAPLLRDGVPLVGVETRVHLRDVHDQAVRILDRVEACRELAASLSELYRSGVSHRMSEQIKLLTVLAGLFLPLGFLAGVYGMILDRPRAGSGAWPFVLGGMALCAGLLLVLLRRRGLLSGDR